MDISEAVTEFHKMKRGNYAVSVNNGASDGASVGITITCSITRTYTRSSYVSNGQGTEDRLCDSPIHNRQQGTTMRQAHSLQREPLQRRLIQQKEWGAWCMATPLGSAKLVVTKTNGRGTRVCASQIRYLVRSVQVPSGEELVLTNESI